MKSIDLNQLNRIKEVEVPTFLFTRIQQKIEQTYSTVLPKKFAFALSLSFIFIVFVNLGAIAYKLKNNQSAASVAESMNLMPNNNLYTNE